MSEIKIEQKGELRNCGNYGNSRENVDLLLDLRYNESVVFYCQRKQVL